MKGHFEIKYPFFLSYMEEDNGIPDSGKEILLWNFGFIEHCSLNGRKENCDISGRDYSTMHASSHHHANAQHSQDCSDQSIQPMLYYWLFIANLYDLYFQVSWTKIFNDLMVFI